MRPSEPQANILLVDDNPANLLSLRALLDGLGQNLVEARSGEDAIERVKADEFAVILLDVIMPGINGFETAKAIRGQERSQHAPIIFLTASDIDRSQMEEGYALGAVDFLVKPILPVAIQAKVRGFVQLFQDKQRATHEAEQLRLLVHGTTEYAIFMLDPHGRVMTWNQGAERFKGYKADEIIGQHFTKFYPQDALDRGWPDHELRVARAEGRFEDEGWRVRKDGSQFWANVVITALRDEQGQLRGFSKVTRDLTERKKAEESLRQSEERFRLLIEGAKDYAIFLLDPHGNVASWNTGAERIKGYETDEIIGQHFSRFYPQDALDRDWPDHELRVARAEGRFEDEGWRVRKDGSLFWANVVITALHDDTGNFRGFSKITRDMTERKKAEENDRRLAEETAARRAAHEERERLHVTLASIGDGVISTDAEGRVDFLNPVAQELVGWTTGEAAGRTLEEVFRIVNEDTRQPVENPALRALRDGKIVGLANHTVLISKEGSERPIDDSAAPIRDAGGRVIGSVLVFRDISDRKRSEAALDERLRLLSLNAAVGEALVRGDGLGAMLQRCAEGLVEHLDAAFARIWTLDGQDGVLELRASAGLYTHLDGPHSRVPVGRYKIGLIAQERKPHLTNAVVGDPRVGDQEWAQREGMVAFAGYPLVVDDRLVGVMALFARRPLSEATLGAMASVADEIAVGVERKTAHERLHEQREWLAVTLASIGDAVITTDAQGRVTFLNGVAQEMTGWALDDAEGRQLVAVFPIVNEQTRRPVENPVEKVLREGVVVGLANHTVLVGRDGTERPIDDSAAPIRDATGKMIGVVLIFRDVTEQRRAEAELRASERELAEFFENATVGLHWVGPDGIILRANRAELDLLGYSREEYVGRPIADFHADEDVICDILERLKGGEKLAEYPARLRCKDGSIRDVLIDSSVLWRDGLFVHTRCFTRDVTERKRAEGRVREQEQRTRTILESVTDAFFGLGRDWRFTYVNRQAEVLLGRTRDDLLGRDIWEEFAPAVGTDFDRSYRRAVAENVAVTFEAFYPPHDHWYEVHAYPSPDGLSVYFRDVGERKRAEIALREQERRFRQLADAMPQIVWTARPDGRIDYLNRRWHEFTGLAETAGNEGWGSLLHPDEAQGAGERWAASVRSGAPFDMELRLRDRGRQSYRWHLIRTIAAKDEAGAVVRWFGTSTDIHEQKRAEESSRYLAEASAALAGVVDYESTLQKVANLAVPHFADWSAVDVANGDGTMRRLAVAHQDADKIGLAHELMRDYPPDPRAPGGALGVLRTGRPEIVAEITDDMLVRGAKDERHLRLIRSLGLRSYICVPLVVSGNPLGVLTFVTAESGRTYTGADLALAVDLAHRAGVAIENTRLYLALRDADRRKDEFLATLAHELRNPLAPIRNALQILKMPRVDAKTIERSRDMMERQVEQLVRLVDDLLDVSRVMRGKIELRREAVELATVVARAVETVQPLVDAQRHELTVHLPTESLPLDADPVRLAQVVGNLLTNAAKYTEPGGHIRLTAGREGGEAVLRIRDDGIGIAPDVLPRIFELFVQVDHASTKAQGGLGIGLTLVKNLVGMHGGSVEARSAGLGQGCEFTVRLPLVAQDRQRPNEKEDGGPQQEPARSSGHRLLVVDDNQDAAVSLAMLLRLQGHEVRVAHSGPAALEAVKDYAPDVVFLDIGMPGMDGYEVARRLRRQPGLEKVVLAALTGWGQQEDRRRTAEAGFDHHLVKPPEPKVVESLLADLKPPDHRQSGG
jgi:PAS domain S-box-containing protein